APRRQPVPPSESPLYLPWWSLLVMVAVVGAAAFALMFAFTQLSEPQVPGNQPLRVQLITEQPTLSQEFAAGAAQPTFWPTAIPQLYPSATVPLPTPIPSSTLPPGRFGIGVTVQVVGVGSSGLNMRSEPGLEGTPRFLAAEEDVFVIVDGPQTVDEVEWWRLEDPNDSSRFGWAARNYLMAVSP
ncbi:MAG TPA: SH3 domain-containing protein, partial [Aggregatilineaceae bacterium]|nr:SH3 domain-containing protein [Aggregatilineaceae bacterium]